MRIIFCIASILLLCSCSSTRYYSSQVDTKDPYVNKTDNGYFDVDGDSVRIHYSFSGENAPIRIKVENRMSRPLFVDWQNSWLSINRSDFQVIYGDYVDPVLSLLPLAPKTEQEHIVIESCNFDFDRLATVKYTKGEYLTEKVDNVKYIDFNERNTPYTLTSHLSLYVGTVGKELIQFENEFYISNLQIVKRGSLNKIDQRGDQFYIKKIEDSENQKPTIWGRIFGFLFNTAIEGINNNTE